MADTTFCKGIVYIGALTILFIGLKLAGCMTCSWTIVLLPIWATIAAMITAAILGVFAGMWKVIRQG